MKAVDILWNRNSKRYFLQPVVSHPTGASTPFGPTLEVAEVDFDLRIASAIAWALDESGKRIWDPDLVVRYSDADYRRHVRDHLVVSVVLIPPDTLEVGALRRVHVGYMGVKDSRCQVGLSEAGKIALVVRKVFECAS